MTQPTSGRKSSRQRFEDYQDKLAARLKQGTAEDDPKSGSKIRSRRVRSAWTLIKEFWRLLGDQRGTVLFALGTLTLATLLALIPPAASKFVIDYVLGDQPIPTDFPGAQWLPASKLHLLYWVAGGILVFSLLKTGLHIWGRWKATSASKRMQMSVRKTVFEHAVRLPLHRVQELRSGGVSSILREDAGSVGPLIFGMLYNPWRAVIQLVGSLLILAWVDWRMLLAALLLIPVVFLSHRLWISRLRPRFRDIRASRETMDAQSAEAFAGMRVVRGFSRQRRETTRFMDNNHYMARQELNTWWWTRYIELLWDFIIPFTSTAVLLYCGMQVLEGRMSVGDVMMFVVYLIMLLEPLAVLAASATEFQNSLSALDRILDLLSEEREMQNSPGTIKVEKATSPGLIRFENVTFRYPGVETAALRHATLEARPGQVIALVGPSGAGKTTLCNLAARFYDPSEGTVTLDGRDLRTIDVESYRQLLGVVEQDIFLFDGTVEENIAYACPEASREEVLHAAHVANAHEFIVDLPDGYDTLIGERGVKLSGGQRQRLAIARAVLADPRILILDEATSNLDTHSERLIQQSLRALMRNRTCFVIAHRLSTITHADEILVLSDGEIRERGSHEELLARDGRYAEMVRLQLEKPEAAMRE